VDFSVDHEFPAPPPPVAAVLCDPAFHTSLDLPDLSRPEVLEAENDGATSRLRLRYEFIGHLDPVARKVLSGQKLTWIQTLTFDHEASRGRLEFAAEAGADRLFGSAQIALVALDDDRSRRHITGELHVKVPLVGGMAEKRIVPGLVRRLDVEAAACTARLTNQE
jgi:hypothetical protein